MRSQSKRLWLVATLTVFAVTAMNLTGLASAERNLIPDLPGACHNHPITLPQFRPFSKKVWNRDNWERGKPNRSAIEAQRKKLKCAAGPGHQKAMQDRWIYDKKRFFHRRSHCLSGPVYAGRVSTFSGGLTAGGYQATEPGIALRNTSTLGETYRVRTSNGTAYLRHIDYGPATWTGRTIDITSAGASYLGGVVTDTWGEAKLIPSECLN